jgi:TonB family protein
MYNPRKVLSAALLTSALTLSAAAQRPRPTDADVASKGPAKAVPTPPKAAPQTFKAKYEGGVFGYRKTMEGTLTFDDAGNRLVFRDDHQKEIFAIPYDSVTQEFADTQKRKPKSASILGSVPLIYVPNPIGFIKTKVRYVTLQFYDVDLHVGGLTSFRVDTMELCESVVATLAEKSGLVPQGEIFVQPRPASSDSRAKIDAANRPAVAVENEALSARVISLPRPTYPDEAREEKITGAVRVLATVDEQGNVVEAEAISGSPKLQAAAVAAAKQAKFEPLMTNGRPVKTKSVISYNFRVD